MMSGAAIRRCEPADLRAIAQLLLSAGLPAADAGDFAVEYDA